MHSSVPIFPEWYSGKKSNFSKLQCEISRLKWSVLNALCAVCRLKWAIFILKRSNSRLQPFISILQPNNSRLQRAISKLQGGVVILQCYVAILQRCDLQLTLEHFHLQMPHCKLEKMQTNT